MKKYLNIIFIGTSYFSYEFLKCLLFSKHNVTCIFTKFNNSWNKIKTPIECLAKSYNINLYKPISWNKIKKKQIKKIINSDISILISYGLKIPNNILDLPKLGFINLHASLLPKWRGPSPINYSILYGDIKTGISIIKINKDIDKGKIIYKKSCIISKKDTTFTLSKKLVKIGLLSIQKIINLFIKNKIKYSKQNDKLATYSKKILRINSKINLYNSAFQIERCIRAFNPWPCSYIKTKDNFVKIWKSNVIKKKIKFKIGNIYKINKYGIQINTSNWILNIKSLQFPNKKIISCLDYYNSNYKNKFFI